MRRILQLRLRTFLLLVRNQGTARSHRPYRRTRELLALTSSLAGSSPASVALKPSPSVKPRLHPQTSPSLSGFPHFPAHSALPFDRRFARAFQGFQLLLALSRRRTGDRKLYRIALTSCFEIKLLLLLSSARPNTAASRIWLGTCTLQIQLC